jgi:hypothetical protein
MHSSIIAGAQMTHKGVVCTNGYCYLKRGRSLAVEVCIQASRRRVHAHCNCKAMHVEGTV